MFCSKKKKHAKIWAEAFKIKDAYRKLPEYEKLYMFAYNRICREFYSFPFNEHHRRMKYRPKTV